MATENPMQMLSANGMRGRLVKPGNSTFSSGSSVSSGLQEEGAQELGMLLGSHAQVDTLNGIDKVLRSGSAPPTFDGSLASMTILSSGSAFGEHFSASRIGDTVGSVDSEEELRSRPEYLAYYYSLINSNPRLPPPIISQENYVLARRLAACAVEEKRKLRTLVEGSSQSLFSAQPLFPTHNEEIESVMDDKVHDGKLYRQVSDNWVNRGGTDKFSGAPDHGLGARHKSLVDLIQEDFPRTPSPVYNQSRSSSHIANKEDDGVAHATQLRDPAMSTGVESSDTLSVSRSATPNNSIGTYNSSKVASLPRMPTPKPANRVETLDDTISGLKFSANLGSASNIRGIASATELAAALKGLNLASTRSPLTDQESEVNHPVEPHGHHRSLLTHRHHSMQFPKPQEAQSQALPHNFYQQQHFSGAQGKYDMQNFSSQSQNTLVQSGASNNMYAAAAAAMPYMAGGNPYYQNMLAANLYTSPAYGLGGYSVNSALIPGMLSNYSGYDTAAAAASETGVHAPTSGSSLDRQQLCKYMSQAAVPIQSSLLDPLCLQYLHQQSLDDAHAMLNATNMPSVPGYVGGSHIDMTEFHKSQLLGYSNDQNHQFPQSGSLITMGSKSGPGSVFPHSSAVAGALSLRQVDRNYRFSPGGGRASIGGAYTGWQCQRGNDASDDIKGSCLLEELKNNKARRFELSDILGHVVEFSADQHGSRFIQQKLETASAEEKAATFQEVMPQALSLMTDVFGNYVIQKFFEHGSSEERSELANQLNGHVLSLSLQMYGCRVIQKALEVVNVDQQILIIKELDGHVMRCVRDQNGNHVIQKCIESVPPEHIDFIISAFYGQVVMLSTHPYGCRVIQRVLEHSTDEQKQNILMEDILRSTCTLAQDQYGNYVVQHVLEHGKPEERKEILTKLAGQIVLMSQHKFASNVVEKCLEFGGPSDRQMFINEMLGHNDANEPLQAMMKDQYANYVVQKVLETCDDQQRELLLSRIRVHLHALKKYTYGKHIVARVEKLLAAGERRGAHASSSS